MANSIAYLVDQDPWGEPDLDTAMNTDFGAGNWDKLSYTTSVFNSQYKFIYIDGSDQNTAFESFIETNTSLIQNWVAAGGHLFINAAVNYDEENNISVGFGVQLATQNYDDAAFFVYAADPNSPIINGPDGNAGTSWSGDYFSHDIAVGGNLTPLLYGSSINSLPSTVLGYEKYGLGWVTIGGMTSPYFHSPQPQSAILEANILAFAAGVTSIGGPPATPPTITGAGQSWYDADYFAFSPLSGVTIGDTNPSAMDTVTITLTAGGVASDANGALSGTNLTKTGVGTYTLAAATPQTLTAELDALVFTPKDGEVPLGQTVTTGVTIAVSDNGLTATDSSTMIYVTAEKPYVVVVGVDGAPGVARLVSGRGGAAPAVTATAYSVADQTYVNPPQDSYADATGGNGGTGANATSPQSNPGSGGAGGSATATATMASGSGAAYTGYTTAKATGGQGGTGGLNSFAVKGGNGGTGGSATASANSASGDALAWSQGGTGGTASGSGATGGAGGQVSGTTAAAGPVSGPFLVTAEADQYGGDGGAGVQGANGGAGASSTLVNAVSAGGAVVYDPSGRSVLQQAAGGAGGDSDSGHGGNGGYAISDLTTGAGFASVSGFGGRGGAGAIGGNGGATWDAATVQGDNANSIVQGDNANVGVSATGGNAGTNGLAGGDAQAKATAIGDYVQADASAHGGLGQTIAGIANASATGTGYGGVSASTDTGLFAGNLITRVFGNASAVVVDTNTALSQAGIATTMPSNPGGAIAYIDALPVATYAARAVAGAPHTIAAMGATPNVVAMGEIGGAHSTYGTDWQTSTASIGLTMDLLQLTSKPDLFLGFYGVGVTGGAGVTDISLYVQADGATLLSEDFSSTTAAKAWFNGHPIDLGSLGSGPLAVDTSLNLSIGMSVTTDQAGSGFSTYLVLGHG